MLAFFVKLLYKLTMVIIRVSVDVKPESCDRFIELMSADAENARSLAGCVCFELLRDPSTPTRFAIYEEWADRESFDGYRTSPVFKDIGARVFPLFDGKPRSAYYQATAFE